MTEPPADETPAPPSTAPAATPHVDWSVAPPAERPDAPTAQPEPPAPEPPAAEPPAAEPPAAEPPAAEPTGSPLEPTPLEPRPLEPAPPEPTPALLPPAPVLAAPAPVLPILTIAAPDAHARAAARERQDRLTKPTGALGRLEDVGVHVASCQGVCPPRPLRRVRVVLFAGDHGVARDGVSAYPPEVTAQMVANFVGGGAAVNALAGVVGATVRVLDLAVDADLGHLPAEVTAHKVRRSSGRIDREDALTRAEALAAFRAGQTVADEEVDAGADLLVPGDMGIGNSTPAAVLTALLTGEEPFTLVGRGTGIDDRAWMRKAAAVRDAVRRGRAHVDDPLGLMAAVGGADIAAMAGFLAQASVRRTPVVLDGVVSGAAALVAEHTAPGASAWWIAGHRSTEPAHRAALTHLRLEPLVDLGLRLGEGTGALLAVPIVQAAVAALAGMATFDEAGVADGSAPDA